MKNNILLAFAIALILLWIVPGIEVPAPATTGVGPGIMTVDRQAGFVENPTPGLVREVTAYNVGVRGQTGRAVHRGHGAKPLPPRRAGA